MFSSLVLHVCWLISVATEAGVDVRLEEDFLLSFLLLVVNSLVMAAFIWQNLFGIEESQVWGSFL